LDVAPNLALQREYHLGRFAGRFRPLNSNVLDVDADGNVCLFRIKHISRRTGASQFSFEHIAA
jgi:hypothetical protein